MDQFLDATLSVQYIGCQFQFSSIQFGKSLLRHCFSKFQMDKIIKYIESHYRYESSYEFNYVDFNRGIPEKRLDECKSGHTSYPIRRSSERP